MEKETGVTRQEVQQALHRRLAGGGLIRRLPDQVIPARMRLGERHGAFEFPGVTEPETELFTAGWRAG